MPYKDAARGFPNANAPPQRQERVPIDPLDGLFETASITSASSEEEELVRSRIPISLGSTSFKRLFRKADPGIDDVVAEQRFPDTTERTQSVTVTTLFGNETAERTKGLKSFADLEKLEFESPKARKTGGANDKDTLKSVGFASVEAENSKKREDPLGQNSDQFEGEPSKKTKKLVDAPQKKKSLVRGHTFTGKAPGTAKPLTPDFVGSAALEENELRLLQEMANSSPNLQRTRTKKTKKVQEPPSQSPRKGLSRGVKFTPSPDTENSGDTPALPKSKSLASRGKGRLSFHRILPRTGIAVDRTEGDSGKTKDVNCMLTRAKTLDGKAKIGFSDDKTYGDPDEEEYVRHRLPRGKSSDGKSLQGRSIKLLQTETPPRNILQEESLAQKPKRNIRKANSIDGLNVNNTEVMAMTLPETEFDNWQENIHRTRVAAIVDNAAGEENVRQTYQRRGVFGETPLPISAMASSSRNSML